MVDERLAGDVKKPVVVFVRDQLVTDGDCRYSPGGASLTDSGRGNSDCGEDQSTPSMSSTSPRHDANSECVAITQPIYYFTKLAFCQLLSASKYIISYRIVSCCFDKTVEITSHVRFLIYVNTLCIINTCCISGSM